jgi:hypothetical protein
MRKIKTVRTFLFGLILLSAASASAFTGDEVPAWLKQAATSNTPTYEKDVPAVVLLDEQTVTVHEDGRVETVSNYAIRILTREGRGYARASAYYLSQSGKVRDIHAWLLRPSGDLKKYGKDETLDVISDPDDIYDELRRKSISAVDDADVGAVFGYTTTTEERSIFGEDQWYFQDGIPVLTSRYTVTLPSGWTAKSKVFNYGQLDPIVSGSSYTWELHNLKEIRSEESSPSFINLSPRLDVSFVSPASAQSSFKTYSNWPEVSRWLTELHDPQTTLDDAIATKARELTANATTELDKIRAVGRYVQNIQYISIDIGIGRGYGMRPHPASQVFAKSYGDCKDKANLMRTMLKALHITAYPVGIYLGDRDHVREEWPSPRQFNHCIIAIKVSDDTKAPTIIQHPELGRLLIFDATNDMTPVGDLSDDEQGSLALIVAGEKGTLSRMPVIPPESSELERNAEVELLADGSMTARIHEHSIGQIAAYQRAEFRKLSKPDYSRRIERWVTVGATGSKVSKVEPVDDMNNGRFDLDIHFAAPNYAQLMQGRLLVFKPAIVARSEFLLLNDSKRTLPVKLSSRAYKETVKVKLPPEFAVDELPDPVKLDTPFGQYSASYEVKEGQLLFSRSLSQNGMTVPVEQYAAARGFFERIRAAEQAPVVLAKK